MTYRCELIGEDNHKRKYRVHAPKIKGETHYKISDMIKNEAEGLSRFAPTPAASPGPSSLRTRKPRKGRPSSEGKDGVPKAASMPTVKATQGGAARRDLGEAFVHPHTSMIDLYASAEMEDMLAKMLPAERQDTVVEQSDVEENLKEEPIASHLSIEEKAVLKNARPTTPAEKDALKSAISKKFFDEKDAKAVDKTASETKRNEELRALLGEQMSLMSIMQEQIALMNKETKHLSNNLDQLSGVTVAAAAGVVSILLSASYDKVPFVVHASLFILLCALIATLMSYIMYTSSDATIPVLMDALKRRFDKAQAQCNAHLQSSPSEAEDSNPPDSERPTSGRSVPGPNEDAEAKDTPTVERKLEAETKEISSKAAMEDKEWKTSGKGILMRYHTDKNPLNCWSQPASYIFKLRGPNYLNDHVKINSEQSRFTTECNELYKTAQTLNHVASMEHSAIHKLRKEWSHPEGSNPFPIKFLIIQFQLPGMTYTTYMKARVGQSPAKASGYTDFFKKFVEGPDDFRNERFKIVPIVNVGSWIVKQVVGGKPALLGRKIECKYHKGTDYLEIDVDISSSYVAQNILSVVSGSCKTLQIDLGFLIEGRCAAELPEVMIGATRFHHVDLEDIPSL
uniref:Protein ENHANCED DISEASE RESISTANCE 2 C-terminal domain-containing protein n=3 Tax=Lotharella globosa TaxID=91324 RepID=A0A7S3YNW0_9EUKA